MISHKSSLLKAGVSSFFLADQTDPGYDPRGQPSETKGGDQATFYAEVAEGGSDTSSANGRPYPPCEYARS